MSTNKMIMCAAIWFSNGEPVKHKRTHSYPDTGLIFAGRYHACCLTTIQNIWPDVDYDQRFIEGFLTTDGDFVGREKAMEIALASSQVKKGETFNSRLLFSEDLFK